MTQVKTKWWRYSRLKTDGTIETICLRDTEMKISELQAEVGGYIEVVPPDYYAGKGWGESTCYCDEESRFKEPVIQNPHFHDLGHGFDIVGDVIRVERVDAP